MIRFYCFIFFYFQIILFNVYGQSVIINEVLAANTTINYDGFGEKDDWIEFYNTSEDTIQMSGMFLTNDSLNPTKHQIGKTVKNGQKSTQNHMPYIGWIMTQSKDNVIFLSQLKKWEGTYRYMIKTQILLTICRMVSKLTMSHLEK